MQLAMIGLGKMGGNMAERLIRGGHGVVTYDRSTEAVQRYAKLGATGASSLADVVKKLTAPRTVWIMVPAGDPVDQTIGELRPLLSEGDIIIDGGNSNFHDTIRRANALREHGIQFIDCGTSGGIWGLEKGYCLMIGGDTRAVLRCEPIFKTLAPPNGFAHLGPSGAGHYVKMIHTGIEYGLLQAYAEGYEILHASRDFLIRPHRSPSSAGGSVVRSWLNELAVRVCDDASPRRSAGLSLSGEGRWTFRRRSTSTSPPRSNAVVLSVPFAPGAFVSRRK